MKNILKRLSMQRKMMLVFAVPIVITQLFISMLCFPRLVSSYENETRHSLEQSVTQAAFFIESYIKNMSYLIEMVDNSWEIQDILSADDFDDNRSTLKQYHEYYRLNKQFDTYEISNGMYRFSLYIPDHIVYSENDYFFRKRSELEQRDDYEAMNEAFGQGKNYFALSRERVRRNTMEQQNMLTLYHRIISKITQKPVGICSISFGESNFIQVMKNANITSNGLVCLLNQEGEGIVSSNEELFQHLSENGGVGQKGLLEWEKCKLAGEEYYAVGHPVDLDGWSILSLIPVSEYLSRYRMIYLLIFLMIVLMLAVVVIVSYGLSHYFVGRLKKLRMNMKWLQEGDLNVQIPFSPKGDELEEVYRNFNFMVGEIRRLMQEHYRLGKQIKMAEVRALQSQINPHFLYNTLDLINWLAMDYGASDIEKITWDMARFYRLSLNHGKSLISIRDEVEHVQVYVNIQKFHYDRAIALHIDVPEELGDLACLNIILQPFVENAIVHGMEEHSEISSCEIDICVRREGEDILFQIRDNGCGMTAEQIERAVSTDFRNQKDGYGIKNINFRLKLCFGEKYGVQYESEVGRGTTAYIRIPAMTMDEAECKIT